MSGIEKAPHSNFLEKAKIEKQGDVKNIHNVVVDGANKNRIKEEKIETKDVIMDGANKHRNKPVDPDINKNTINAINTLFPIDPKEVADSILEEKNPSAQIKKLMSFQSEIDKMTPDQLNSLKSYLKDTLSAVTDTFRAKPTPSKENMASSMLDSVEKELESRKTVSSLVKPAHALEGLKKITKDIKMKMD